MKKKVGDYIYAVLIAVLGIVMILKPEQVMNYLCYAIGAVLIVLGIVKLVAYASKDIKDAIYGNDFSLGVILIICGVLFIIKSETIQNLVPIFIGLIIVASGIGKLQHAINLRRFKSSSSTFVLIISILCIGVGAVLLFAASTVNKIITMIIGVGFLVSGLSDIATYVVLSNKVKKKEEEDHIINTDNVAETVENPQVVEPAEQSEENNGQ